MASDAGALVLVTGISGSIGGAVARVLHDKGFRVRGTVRDISDAAAVGHLEALVPGVEVVTADLLCDDGWDAACAGCSYVMHVASPFPLVVKDADEVLLPAIEGTKRVLAAAAAAGVKRVVLTSSCAAVAYGHEGTPLDVPGYVYSEADWSQPEGCDAYAKSKTLAERAAWEFVKGRTTPELVTINPCYVQGPMTSARSCSSLTLVRRLLGGELPAVANVGLQLCDIRDVADAHAAAMTAPAAAGQRYIVHSASVTLPELAALLAAEYGPRGYAVPTRRAPRWLLSVMALFDAEVRGVVANVDKQKLYDASKAARDLGLRPRAWQDAVRATADSLIAAGHVKPRT